MGIRIVVWVFCAVVFLSGCDLVDNSPCGPRRTFDLYLLGSNIVDTTGNVFNSYMEGNNRVFQWSKLVDSVCTDEHVKSNFRIALLDETSAPLVKVRGVVSWQFLYERTYDATPKGSDYVATAETGLKQAFPDLQGWFVPALQVYFPTKGSYDSDTAFLKEHIISVEISCNYREYK